MAWEFAPNAPIYIQISENLKTAMLKGLYPPGSQLPSVRQIAKDAAVNPNTVQKSISLLESEGLVVIKGTQGCFVTEDRRFLVKAKENQAKKLAKKLVETAKELSIASDEMLNLIKEEYEK